MSRRRSSRELEDEGASGAATVALLLDELCVELGFCLPPDAKEALEANPPGDVDAFTDAVLLAEGMDPVLTDSALRRSVREKIKLRIGHPLSGGRGS